VETAFVFASEPVPSAAALKAGVSLQRCTVMRVYRAASQRRMRIHCRWFTEQGVALSARIHGRRRSRAKRTGYPSQFGKARYNDRKGGAGDHHAIEASVSFMAAIAAALALSLLIEAASLNPQQKEP